MLKIEITDKSIEGLEVVALVGIAAWFFIKLYRG